MIRLAKPKKIFYLNKEKVNEKTFLFRKSNLPRKLGIRYNAIAFFSIALCFS